MGKGGGFGLGLFGMILTLTGVPILQVLGVGLMTGGAIWSGIEQRREMQRALDQMRKEGEFGLKANTRTTQRAIPLVFGETRVGGNIVYMGTGGMRNPEPNVVVNNQDLYLIFGVSEGPIDSFREMYFNEMKVWDVQSGNLQTPFRDSFLFDYRLGVSSQAPYTQVNSIDLDFSETYPNVATAMVRLRYNRAIFQSIPAVTFLVRGIKCFDPATPGDGRKWTFNPAHVLYNLMTNKRYGWGVASARIEHSSFVAVGSYAGQKLTAFSDQVTELIETTVVGPREFNDPVYIPTGITATSFNVTSLRAGFDIGGATWPSFWSDANPSRFPIRPGSLCIGTIPEEYLWLTSDNVFYYWYVANAFHDSPTSGDNSQYGFIVKSGTATKVGSVDYFTGWVNINSFTAVPWAWNYGSFPVRWFANYGGTYRTQYQYLARSVEVWCGSEVLVEVTSSFTGSGWYWTTASGVIYLASNSGGAGTIDHQQGIVQFYFGTVEWYNNEPVYIKYKLGAEVTDFPVTRFSFHGMISNADPGLDVMRDVCQHMRGFLVYVNGQYKLKCDFPGSTVYDFDDDNILAGTFRVNKAPLMERPSRIRVKFVDALAGYTVSEIKYDVGTPDVLAQTRREQTLVLMGCKYRDFAVRVGGTLANQVLWNTSVEFGTTLDAAALEPGDLVTVTHPAASWTSKVFRIVGISEEKDSTLEVSAVEHDDTMYTDLWIGGELKTPSPSAYPQRPPNISLVTSLGVSELTRTLTDGTVQPFIKIIPYVSASAGLVPNLRVMGMYDGNNQPHQVLYEGPFKSPIEYGPVAPGNWHLTAYSLNEYMVPWPVPVYGGTVVLGPPELEWQRLRFRSVANYQSNSNFKRTEIFTITNSYGIDTIFLAQVYKVFSSAIRVTRLLNDQPLYTSVVSFDVWGAGETSLAFTTNSGSNPTLFMWNSWGTFGITFSHSLTIIRSLTCVVTGGIGLNFSNPAAYTYDDGDGKIQMRLVGYLSNNVSISYIPVSTSLFASSYGATVNAYTPVMYAASDPGDTISVITTSSKYGPQYGFLFASFSEAPSWDAVYFAPFSMTSPFSVTDASSRFLLLRRSKNASFTERTYRVGGIRSDMLVLAQTFDDQTGSQIPSLSLRSFRIQMDGVTTPTAYFYGRMTSDDDIFSDPAWDNGAYWGIKDMSRPSVSHRYIRTYYPKPLTVVWPADSRTGDYNIIRYWDVISNTPEEVQTWAFA